MALYSKEKKENCVVVVVCELLGAAALFHFLLLRLSPPFSLPAPRPAGGKNVPLTHNNNNTTKSATHSRARDAALQRLLPAGGLGWMEGGGKKKKKKRDVALSGHLPRKAREKP